MTKEITAEVLNQIIEESHKKMKENAEVLLNGDFDFAAFNDRNTMARVMFEVLANYELEQYKAVGLTTKGKSLKSSINYYLLMNHK